MIQKGQRHAEEHQHHAQVEMNEPPNHLEQASGDHTTNAQGPPKELSLSESSLKRKASYNDFSTGRETPTKSTKHVSQTPIFSSQETASASPYLSKFIPDSPAISNSIVPIRHDKIPITSNLSPTLLNFGHVQLALQTYYEPYLKIQRVSGDTLSLESCYINLAIVEASYQRQKDKEDLKAQAVAFNRMPSYEQITKTNMMAPIPLEKLFDKRKLRDEREDVPKTILIQGRAGIGKTTLCKKLVHLYQSGLWKDRFDAVLWLPLRQLKAYKACDLEDLLWKKYFAHHLRQKKESLVATLVNRKDKVLFILDGLDEILTDTQTEDGIALKEFLMHLLRQEHVVITSRPSGVDVSILPKLDLELETVGFSTKNVIDYISSVLASDDAKSVQDFIKRVPSIQGLVNIPVQLDIVCYSWDSLPSNDQSITMTELYRAMVRKLWCKDVERLQRVGASLTPQRIHRLPPYQIDNLVATESEYLSFLAFKGMQNEHKIEFDEPTLLNAMQELDELRKMANQEHLPYQLLDELKQTSFLHTADAELDITKDDSQRAWYFLHLTFQEYFAATWLVRHFQVKQRSPNISSMPMMTVEEATAYIQRHKYNPRYQIVWWMVAGLLQGETLVSFLKLLQGAPVDLIGGYHHHLLAGCLSESRNQLDAKSVADIENRLEQWLPLEMVANDDIHGRSAIGIMGYFPEELIIRNISRSGAWRNYLIRTLGMRPSLTQSAIEVLMNDLQDKDFRVRSTAVEALRKQLTLPESALQALIGALQDENQYVRESAADALRGQSILPESALQTLIHALQDENQYVRQSAARALGKQSILPESALQALINALQDEDENVRQSAAEALEEQPTLPESALQALIGTLQDENQYVRQLAASALGKQPILPESALQALISALKDEHEDVKWSATEALEGRSTLPESALQALTEALQDENQYVRQLMASALGKQPILPESALQALISALQDEDEDVRWSAAEALERQSTLPELVLQALIEALQDDNQYVMQSVAKVLGKQSTLPESALQTLIGALQDENEDVRQSAAKALGNWSTLPESSLQALIDALQDDNHYVRQSVTRALGEQSTLPESALQALIDALQDDNQYVMQSVAKVLGKQLTLPESALQTLITALQGENEDVRQSAAEALEAQSTLPESSLQALIDTLQDENLYVRKSVARVLENRSTLPESSLQALIDALQDENRYVRQSVVRALGKQSTLPQSALQALICTLPHLSKDVCGDIVIALERHINTVFMAIPRMPISSIEILHRSFLINYSSKYSASLWVQDHQVFFHSAQGPMTTDKLSTEDLTKVVEAFNLVRKVSSPLLNKE